MNALPQSRNSWSTARTIALACGWLLAAATASVAHAQQPESYYVTPAVRNFGAAPTLRASSVSVPAAPAVYTTLYGDYAGPAWNVGYGPYRPWLYRPRYFYPYRQYPLQFGYSYYNPYAYYAPWYGTWSYPHSAFYQPAYSYLPYGGVPGLYGPLGYGAYGYNLAPGYANYGGCYYW